jgi:hypothetical protein
MDSLTFQAQLTIILKLTNFEGYSEKARDEHFSSPDDFKPHAEKLRERIRQLSGFENTLIKIRKVPQLSRIAQESSSRELGSSERPVQDREFVHQSDSDVGAILWFKVSPDRIRSLLKYLGAWLNSSDNTFTLLTAIRYGRIWMRVETSQAEHLFELVYPIEYLVSPEEIYLARAKAYSSKYGEIKPVQKEALELLRQRLDISTEESDLLLAQAVGPFRTLEEKKSYFREVVLKAVNKLQRSSEDNWEDKLNDYWRDMMELAKSINLPQEKALLVWEEFTNTIESGDASEDSKQAYEKIFDFDISKNSLEGNPKAELKNRNRQLYRDLFRRLIEPSQDLLPFDEGRLAYARKFLDISLSEAQEIEGEVKKARKVYNAI